MLARENTLFPAMLMEEQYAQCKYSCHQLVLALTVKRMARLFFASIF